MSRQLYYYEPKDETVWSNPDLPSVRELIDEGEPVELTCPNPDGCEQTFTIALTDGKADVGEMIDTLRSKFDGTMRCSGCDEPHYGIHGDGDHDDDYQMEGWNPSFFRQQANGNALGGQP